MKIALLNMMPDAALKATDRQFMRLLSSRPEADFYRVTIPEIERPQAISDYLAVHYISPAELRDLQPDGLIITGTNVSNPRLENQVFWQPLRETLDWSLKNVRSTLCSCLASHAVMQFHYGHLRTSLPEKIWGIYDHEVRLPAHPLAQGLPATVPVPQSRFNQVSEEQFRQAGLQVIIASDCAGVHLAGNDDHSLVLMQGHPEYDDVSLLKEYKREVRHFSEDGRDDYPPIPAAMVDEAGRELLEAHAVRVKAAGQSPLDFPEKETTGHLHESWRPAATRVFENWLGLLNG